MEAGVMVTSGRPTTLSEILFPLSGPAPPPFGARRTDRTIGNRSPSNFVFIIGSVPRIQTPSFHPHG